MINISGFHILYVLKDTICIGICVYYMYMYYILIAWPVSIALKSILCQKNYKNGRLKTIPVKRKNNLAIEMNSMIDTVAH